MTAATTRTSAKPSKPAVVGPWKPARDDSRTCLRMGWQFCGIWHRTADAAKRHCEKLNRREGK